MGDIGGGAPLSLPGLTYQRRSPLGGSPVIAPWFLLCSIRRMTRGDVLRYNLAFALSRAIKIVRGLRQRLTEAERYAVADHVVTQLKQRGDPWHLSEEARPNKPPST